MIAIYKRELNAFFTSMLGYFFVAFFVFFVALSFVSDNLAGQSAQFEYTLIGTTIIFIFIFPFITMRLMAEEKRQKTDQLLLTAPVKVSNIIIGKYLAALSVFMVSVVITMLFPLIMSRYGNIWIKTVISGYMGFILLGAVFVAIGLFISTLTESQGIAAVISFIVYLVLFVIDTIVQLIPKDRKTSIIGLVVALIIICLLLYLMMQNVFTSVAAGVVGAVAMLIVYFVKPELYDGAIIRLVNGISVLDKYTLFFQGIIDVSVIVYYLSIIFVFLFLSVQAVQKRRWS